MIWKFKTRKRNLHLDCIHVLADDMEGCQEAFRLCVSQSWAITILLFRSQTEWASLNMFLKRIKRRFHTLRFCSFDDRWLNEWRNGRINPLTPNETYRGITAPLTSEFAFYIFIQQIYVLNILNMVYTLRFFFSSKCSLFHNSNVFGSCIIHILYTGCAKIKKKKFRRQKVKQRFHMLRFFSFDDRWPIEWRNG